MSDEQQQGGGLDDLDRIALEASGMESAQDQRMADLLDPEPPGVDPAEAWAAIPKIFGSLMQIAMPELAGVYNDQACLTWGGAMNEVAKKHKWDAADTMSRWAPEIGLLFASVPLIVPTVQAIRARRTEAEKQDAEKRAAKPADVQDGAIHQPAPENGTKGPQNVPQGGGFVEPS